MADISLSGASAESLPLDLEVMILLGLKGLLVFFSIIDRARKFESLTEYKNGGFRCLCGKDRGLVGERRFMAMTSRMRFVFPATLGKFHSK